ncbi:hypothetical protein DID88_007314 [Monilinia fructigena]|uniref:Uncharacterized protein n=1 Tax=Monilinia fructigena TaxID=38457 RepID=A0A395J8N6_9HELO|nr:hypothetical protein DID88_007314 [Monilinia fructigena]
MKSSGLGLSSSSLKLVKPLRLMEEVLICTLIFFTSSTTYTHEDLTIRRAFGLVDFDLESRRFYTAKTLMTLT